MNLSRGLDEDKSLYPQQETTPLGFTASAGIGGASDIPAVNINLASRSLMTLPGIGSKAEDHCIVKRNLFRRIEDIKAVPG